MTKPLDIQTLVIPAGVQIRAEGDGFVLGNEHDIVLKGPPSIPLLRVISNAGSITVESDEPISVGQIEAARGDVQLSGHVTVKSIHARRIFVSQASLNIREMVADELISFVGDSIQADIIMAPIVEIGNGVRGRATVLESKNEIGPTLLKGGFRLEEYLEIFPAGREWLDQFPTVKLRLEGWAQVTVPAIPTRALPPNAPRSDSPASGNGAASLPEPEVLTLTDQVASDILEVELEDEPRQAPAKAPDVTPIKGMSREAMEDMYQRMSESFLRIMGCYSDAKLPPPLSALESLIEERRFDVLRKSLTGLWNELLQYHKREGMHIANTVTHNIQEMKRMLQGMN